MFYLWVIMGLIFAVILYLIINGITENIHTMSPEKRKKIEKINLGLASVVFFVFCILGAYYGIKAEFYSSPPVTGHASSSSNSHSASSSSFTNKYGTPTTICAHTGCTNYIASTGDTNCCTTHSKRCANCGKYIDEDALYCMDCISSALKK